MPDLRDNEDTLLAAARRVVAASDAERVAAFDREARGLNPRAFLDRHARGEWRWLQDAAESGAFRGLLDRLGGDADLALVLLALAREATKDQSETELATRLGWLIVDLPPTLNAELTAIRIMTLEDLEGTLPPPTDREKLIELLFTRADARRTAATKDTAAQVDLAITEFRRILEYHPSIDERLEADISWRLADLYCKRPRGRLTNNYREAVNLAKASVAGFNRLRFTSGAFDRMDRLGILALKTLALAELMRVPLEENWWDEYRFLLGRYRSRTGEGKDTHPYGAWPPPRAYRSWALKRVNSARRHFARAESAVQTASREAARIGVGVRGLLEQRGDICFLRAEANAYRAELIAGHRRVPSGEDARDWAQAEIEGSLREALGYYLAGCSDYSGDPGPTARISNKIGLCHDRLGRIAVRCGDDAREHWMRGRDWVSQALDQLEGSGRISEKMVYQRNLGEILLALGDDAGGLQALRRAAQLAEDQVGDDPTDPTSVAWLRREAWVVEPLLSNLALAGQVDEAAIWWQLSWNRELADFAALWNSAPTGVVPGALTKWRDLRKAAAARIDMDYYIQYCELYLDQKNIANQMREGRDDLRAREVELQRDLTALDPGWRGRGRPFDVDAIRDLAEDADAALLMLRATADGIFALLACPDRTLHVDLLARAKFGRGRLAELILRSNGSLLRTYLTARANNYDPKRKAGDPERSEECWLAFDRSLERFLETLGQEFWSPIREWLQSHYPPGSDLDDAPRPLVIMPSGPALEMLPFDALPYAADGCLEHAGDEYLITIAPSPSILATCLRRARQLDLEPVRSYLAIANANGDEPWHEAELDWIARLTPSIPRVVLGAPGSPGGTATAEAFYRLAPDHPFLHLNGHGHHDLVCPWDSELELTKPDRIRLVNLIQRLTLPRTRCVTLAECETGMSDPWSEAGGMLSYPAILLALGAASAVCNLWCIDATAPTVLLMGEFYRNLFHGDHPISPAMALRTAKRWLRARRREEAIELVRGLSLPKALRRTAIRRIRLADSDWPFAHPYNWCTWTCYGWF